MNSSSQPRPGATPQGGAVRRNLHDQIEAVTQVQPSQRGGRRAWMWRVCPCWPTSSSPEALGCPPGGGAGRPGAASRGTRWLLLQAGGRGSRWSVSARRVTLLSDRNSTTTRKFSCSGAPISTRWTGRTQQAMAGFRRRGRAVLEAYSDDLQGRMRLALAQIALEAGEIELARREAAAIGGSSTRTRFSSPDALSLLGLRESILAIRAPGSGPRRVCPSRRECRAALCGAGGIAAARTWCRPWQCGCRRCDRWLRSGWWFPGAAMDVEVRTLGLLGRLYAQEGRWRDAFLATRNANFFFPDHPVARDLHDETARIFDEIFLGGRDEGLDEVEAVALFLRFPGIPAHRTAR